MNQPPTNICPLLAIASIGRTEGGQPTCIEDHCALWDFAGSECSLVAIVDAIREARA